MHSCFTFAAVACPTFLTTSFVAQLYQTVKYSSLLKLALLLFLFLGCDIGFYEKHESPFNEDHATNYWSCPWCHVQNMDYTKKEHGRSVLSRSCSYCSYSEGYKPCENLKHDCQSIDGSINKAPPPPPLHRIFPRTVNLG